MISKRKKGLTLLEIIAVVIIAGILAAVGMTVYNNYFNTAELGAYQAQADVLQSEVAKYMADNGGELPLINPEADIIAKPEPLNLAVVAKDLDKKLQGNYYLYGPNKKVSFDYPVEYILEVYNTYPGDKSEILIEGTPYIDTDKLYEEGLIEYPAFTSYVLMDTGTITQVLNQDGVGQSVNSSKNSQGKEKPTKPIIIPSKSAPYYATDEITFEAQSYSQKGEVSYKWTGVSETKKYSVGSHQITVVAVDVDGNESETAVFNFQVLSESQKNLPPSKPIIKVTPNKSVYGSHEVIKLTATSTDPNGDPVTYIWNGKTANDKYSRGKHVITVYAVDSQGLTSEKSEEFIINVKNGKPTINGVTMNPDPAYFFEAISFEANAVDPDNDMLAYEWEIRDSNNKLVRKGQNVNGRYDIGKYKGKVRVKDSYGEYSEWYEFSFDITNKPPTVPTLEMNPGPNSNLRPNTKITFTASGSVDPDDTPVTYEWENKKSTYGFGTHTVKVRGVDADGGKSQWATITFTVKNTAPTKPTITMSPNNNNLKANTQLTFSVGGSTDAENDSFSYLWSKNGVSWSSTKPDGKYARGTHTVYAKAVDEWGAESQVATLTFTITNSAPSTPSISMSPSSGLKANTNITFTPSGSTDIDGDSISYEWVNKKSQYPRGTHTVQVRAKDSQGAYSSYASKTFTVENSAPVMSSFTTNKSTYAPGDTITYYPIATDIDGDSLTYEYSNKITIASTPGTHTIEVRAKDGHGGVSAWKSVTITVQNRAPSAPVISVSPNQSIKPTTHVTFSATSTDPDGHPVTIEWKKCSSCAWTTSAPNGTYPEGDYTIYARAKDSLGAYSATTSYNFVSVKNSYDLLFRIKWSGNADLDFHGYVDDKHVYYGNRDIYSGSNSIHLNMDNTWGNGYADPEVITVNGFYYKQLRLDIMNWDGDTATDVVLEIIDRANGKVLKTIYVGSDLNQAHKVQKTIAYVNLQGPGETTLDDIISYY